MKIKLCKGIVFAFLVGMFSLLSFQPTAAAYTDFSGNIGGNQLTFIGSNKKADTAQQAYVYWKGSSRTSHKTWFEVQNSVGAKRGSALFNYKAQGWINTSGTAKGYVYHLKAKRENWVDPSTYIHGTWDS